MPRTEQVTFRGIDGFNRPIFQSLKFDRNFFGSLDKLFDSYQTEEGVLEEVTADNLTFFGSFFGCEPMGDRSATLLEIVKNEDVEDMPKLHLLPAR